MLRTDTILTRQGYSFVKFTSPRVEPERAREVFADLIPILKAHPLGSKKLYKHQLEAYTSLAKGANLILRSGTGSGKTEAWITYVLAKATQDHRLRVLAVYPTLALANDQIRRIREYATLANLNVIQLDSQKRQELEREHGRRGLRELIASADIVATNPAYLLYEVKRLIENPRKPLLEPFLRKLYLLVIDELDFYGPRSIALLLAMIKLLAEYTQEKLQVVILTATLANPNDVAEYLSSITGRETKIVDGKPFHSTNHTYIVLGKDLDKLWRTAQEYAKTIWDKLDPRIRRALEDIEEFKKNAYLVTSYLEALGADLPSPGVDITEIIANYVDDEYATLVFTRSIASAEQLARALREKLGRDNAVATHHHLVPKKKREEIEDAVRAGRLKLIISPRTLVQGIDIGTIARIVHVGLPEDVREFLQREGRKGRRPDIEYTETVILPISRWDRELLSKGINTLKKWIELGPEKTIINPRNKYAALFTGLAKLVSPWLPRELDKIEEEALRNTGVITRNGVNMDKARQIRKRIRFYEYGLPYGIKRYLDEKGELKPLEPIGFCDLVERFQPGCIDHGSDAIVVELRRAGKSRIVTAVVEKPLREFNPWHYDALAEAIEEYEYVKRGWGEKPSLLRDIARAKLVTHVLAVVYPPRRGFGLLRKIPNRVIWTLYSEKPRIIETKTGHIVVYDRRQIYVPVNTAGEYRDYTYGYVVEASDEDDPTLLRLGLALVAITLRRLHGYSLDTIHYGIEKLGERKLVEIHEPEAAGIIESLDWAKLRKEIEHYEPDELDTILLQQIDEIAYTDLLTHRMDWNIAKSGAMRVLDLLTSIGRVKALIAGRVVEIPKPSRAHRILAVDIVAEEISTNEAVPEVLVAISWFDGEQVNTAIDVYTKLPFTKPPRTLLEAESTIEDLVVYEGFKLLVESKDSIRKALVKAGLRRLEHLLDNALEIKEAVSRAGLEPKTPLSVVAEALGLEQDTPRLEELVAHLASTNKPGHKFLEKLRNYQASRVKQLYITYLALNQLTRQHHDNLVNE